jgi:hypothetical protein
MLGGLLAYQLQRQTDSKRTENNDINEMAQSLARIACEQKPDGSIRWLEQFLGTAEFLARETRSPSEKGGETSPLDAPKEGAQT